MDFYFGQLLFQLPLVQLEIGCRKKNVLINSNLGFGFSQRVSQS